MSGLRRDVCDFNIYRLSIIWTTYFALRLSIFQKIIIFADMGMIVLGLAVAVIAHRVVRRCFVSSAKQPIKDRESFKNELRRRVSAIKKRKKPNPQIIYDEKNW